VRIDKSGYCHEELVAGEICEQGWYKGQGMVDRVESTSDADPLEKADDDWLATRCNSKNGMLYHIDFVAPLTLRSLLRSFNKTKAQFTSNNSSFTRPSGKYEKQTPKAT